MESLVAAPPPRRIHALLDAFRGQLFCRDYSPELHLPCSTAPAAIVSVNDWLKSLQPGDMVSGPVLSKLVDSLPPGALPAGVTIVDRQFWHPHAKTVALLGADAFARGCETDFWRLVPRYVRQAAAEERAAEG
jgi:hypothetical protein